jgi:hypothetical protein
MRAAVDATDSSLLAEDIMDIRAWRAVIGAPWRARRSWPMFQGSRGMDLSAWSGAMRRRLMWSTTLQAAAMIDGAVASMARRGVSISRAMTWFENQPQERAFALALRRNFKGVRLTGFLQYHFSRLAHAGIIPTREQFDAGVLPDEIACTGRTQFDWLCRECPWQRFSILRSGRFCVPSGVSDASNRVVLVVTPSDDRIALRMGVVARSVAESLGPAWKVRIRLHPANRRGEHGGLGPANLELDASPSIESSILTAAVVVGGGGSGVVLARSGGWPVVILTLQGEIDADPFPPNHGLNGVLHAHDATTLVQAIVASTRLPALERAHGLFA